MLASPRQRGKPFGIRALAARSGHGPARGVSAIGLLAVLAVAAGAGCLTASPDGDSSPTAATQAPSQTSTSTNPSIKWHNFTEGIALAAVQGKPVMLDFYADWCYWCRVLDARVYSDPRVVSASSDFVAVKEEVTGDSPFIDRYSVYYLPLVLWLDPNGTTLVRLDGYVDTPTFLEYMGRALQQFRAQGVP